MIGVTAGFKTAIKSAGRQLKAYLDFGDGGSITESDDLQSLSIIAEGGLCRTVMREASATYFGEHDYLNTTASIGIGVVLPDTTTEYIDYGHFRVVEIEENIGSGVTTAKLYDQMYDAMQRFAITPTYPLTVVELVQAICTELGWTLATTTFPNSTVSITSDLFTEPQMTYRDVLNQVAEASGSVMYFDVDNELVIRNISATVLETVDVNSLISIKLEPVYGELNSVVLSRMPQEDNIVEQDTDSITTYGLNEFKIVNNSILDGDRETYVTPIFTVLNGIMYYPFEADTIGLGYFEIGDRIKLQDLALNEFEVIVMNIELNMAGGLGERIWASIPEKSTTPYDYAGIIGQTIKNTEIKVDKVQGEVTILSGEVENALVVPRQPEPPASPTLNDLWLDTDDNVLYIWNGTDWVGTGIDPALLDDYYTKDETESIITTTAGQITLSVEATQTAVNNVQALVDGNSEDIVDVQSQVTQLELDVDGLQITAGGVGGSNLIKNSVGLKGSIEEWQELVDGVLVDSDNDGTIVQTADVVENSESGSSIKIENQFILQTIPTIEGGTYTLYMRFKRLEDLVLTITGVIGDIPITAGEYVDETWSVFKYQFVATNPDTTIKISNVASDVGAYAILTDTVCILGDTNGWTPAPNEVYGQNYRFDKDGFSITSLTDEFKAILDNVKLGIYDTSGGVDKIMALFSKDAGLITKLVAQDELVLQRYQNSAKSTRFIPTATGSMITVNT